jgi:hypothetical protein
MGTGSEEPCNVQADFWWRWVISFVFLSRWKPSVSSRQKRWAINPTWKGKIWRLSYSGMLRFVALVKTDVSEECNSSIISVTRIDYLGITLAITSNRRTLRRNSIAPSWPIPVTLMMEAIRSPETSTLTRDTRRHIPEGGSLRSHRREFLKPYIALTGWAL